MHNGAAEGKGGDDMHPGASSQMLTFDDTSAVKSRVVGCVDERTGGVGRGSSRMEQMDVG